MIPYVSFVDEDLFLQMLENLDQYTSEPEIVLISGRMYHRLSGIQARSKARAAQAMRQRKRERRQQRAAFRRRKRGMA